ncbi:MAG: signal peptidase II [Erythrobacter sp.]
MIAQLFTKARVIGLALAAAIFAVDQWLKHYVIGPLNLRTVGNIELLPFFDFTYVENRGVSLGLLEATSMEMRWLLVAGTAVIALVVLIWMMRERLMGDILGLSLILGGALGNIYDRYYWGYVIDYADLHFGTWRPFLIFNVADACITIGVVIILVRSLFFSEKEEDDTDTSHLRPAES